jgi:GNAT superfamily N-acetyltransferase
LFEYETMGRWPLALGRASERDLSVIVHLIDEAAAWLRTRNTDQWALPWPSQSARDDRIRADLKEGKTWIGWDGETAAATITVDPDEHPYWPDQWHKDPAIYVHRLVVSRPYAGVELGAALLDWAAGKGLLEHGATWIRVNAWTTNKRLHEHYESLGFIPCGFCPDDGYPSGAMYQRPTSLSRAMISDLFVEVPAGRRQGDDQ